MDAKKYNVTALLFFNDSDMDRISVDIDAESSEDAMEKLCNAISETGAIHHWVLTRQESQNEALDEED